MDRNSKPFKENCLLVVDDDIGILILMKALFDSEGFQALYFTKGKYALEKIEEGYGTMLVTDMQMPGMDGLELTRRVRQIKPSMPVIMITGDFSRETDQLAVEAGICKVLHKPCEPGKLLNIVNDLNEKIANERIN